MKALVLMDSFKGSISSKELNSVVEEELNLKEIDTISFPISDGGEGFLDAVNASNIKYVQTLNGDLQEEVLHYSYNGNSAFIELAIVCGMSKSIIKNPMHTSTYGVGILIKDAISSGFKNIYLGIGGSSTNDLGLGLIEALGAKIYSNQNLIRYVSGKDLNRITSIDYTGVLDLIKNINIYTLSDVKNPLIGINGAAKVYASQKGASLSDIEVLEQGAINIAKLLANDSYIENKDFSGASGGVGYIMQRIFNSQIISGIKFIFNYHNIYKHTDIVDFIITGEGKVDNQSFQGKVISGIIEATTKPIIVLTGINEVSTNPYDNLFIHSIVPLIATKDYSIKNPKECIRKLIKSISI